MAVLLVIFIIVCTNCVKFMVRLGGSKVHIFINFITYCLLLNLITRRIVLSEIGLNV